MSETKKCIFCDETALFNEQSALNQSYRVTCPNCGIYVISDIIADHDIDTVESYSAYKPLISGLIREKNDLGLKIEMITTHNIASLINDYLVPKTILQKFDKILLHYYRKSNQFGSWLNIDEKTPYSIGYATNYDEFFNMANTLVQLGFFNKITNGGKMLQFNVSLKGMIRAEELLSTNTNSNKVFIAMGFYPDLFEALTQAIKTAAKESGGFEAFIIPETEHNGDINDRIIAEIKKSKFMIADFTYNNQGAYFETGYAQGRGLEVIRTCNKKWFEDKDENGNNKNHLHFDVNHYNFILWDDFTDLKEKLKNRIAATIL
jgi:nucleoside 2-deoxyribosyltransferase